MPFVLCNRTTFVAVSASRWDPLTADKDHVLVEVLEMPDLASVRWDGGTGLRAASSTEIKNEDDKKKATEVEQDVSNRVIEALVEVLAPKLGLSVKALRDELVAATAAKPKTTTLK